MEIKKINGMRCGMFNNSSYWGYRSSVLKSGVCKYYRREMFDKFEWCVMEMMIFGLKNEGMMTNIINRIKILIFEEIVVNEINNYINSTFETNSNFKINKGGKKTKKYRTKKHKTKKYRIKKIRTKKHKTK